MYEEENQAHTSERRLYMKKILAVIILLTVFLSSCASSDQMSEAENSQVDNSQIDNSEVDNPEFDNSEVDNSQIDNSEIDNSEIDNSEVDNSKSDVSQDETSAVIQNCLSYDENGVYTLTLPESKTKIKLKSEHEPFVSYISNALVREAEKKISPIIAKHEQNTGFYLDVIDNYLCLCVEAIVYFDEPKEGVGCGDHDHLFYNERISTKSIGNDTNVDNISQRAKMVWDSRHTEENQQWTFSVTIPELKNATVEYRDDCKIYVNGEYLLGGMASGCESFYLADVTGDGLPELCFGMYFGSGIVDYRVTIYDFSTKEFIFSLSDRMKHNYLFFEENGVLCVSEQNSNTVRKGMISFNGTEVYVLWNETPSGKVDIKPITVKSGDASITPFSSFIRSTRDNGDGTFTQMHADRISMLLLLSGELSSFNPWMEIPEIITDNGVEFILPENTKISGLSLFTYDGESFIESEIEMSSLANLIDGTYYVVAQVSYYTPKYSYQTEDVFRLIVPTPTPNIDAFSYKDDLKIYTEGTPGVKYSGFKNLEESTVTTKEEAVERAKNECTIPWNVTNVYFDEREKVWMVLFYQENVLGGCQSVYMGADGITLLIVYGE